MAMAVTRVHIVAHSNELVRVPPLPSPSRPPFLSRACIRDDRFN